VWVDVFLNMLLFTASTIADWAAFVQLQQKRAANLHGNLRATSIDGNHRQAEALDLWTPAFRQAAELRQDIQRIELPASARM